MAEAPKTYVQTLLPPLEEDLGMSPPFDSTSSLYCEEACLHAVKRWTQVLRSTK